MTQEEQAINLLNNAVAEARLSRAGHVEVQNALQLIVARLQELEELKSQMETPDEPKFPEMPDLSMLPGVGDAE